MEVDLGTKIEDMDFRYEPWDERMATRIRNKLRQHGIMTLGQLVRTDVDDLPPGLSIVSKLIITEKLKAFGLSLPNRRQS